jgi:hypothetical protein
MGISLTLKDKDAEILLEYFKREQRKMVSASGSEHSNDTKKVINKLTTRLKKRMDK